MFGQERDSNPRPSTWQTSKNPQKTRSRRSYISVAVSRSQFIKLIKSVISLVLQKEKRKVTIIICVFLRKAPTKKQAETCQVDTPLEAQTSSFLTCGKSFRKQFLFLIFKTKFQHYFSVTWEKSKRNKYTSLRKHQQSGIKWNQNSNLSKKQRKWTKRIFDVIPHLIKTL